jgi:hypothetical protein
VLSGLPEVNGDVYRNEAHALVEGPGRGMEGVRSACPDGDDLDAFSGHVVEGAPAQGPAQAGGAVVIGPLAVLVGVDDLSDQRPEVVFVVRACDLARPISDRTSRSGNVSSFVPYRRVDVLRTVSVVRVRCSLVRRRSA